MKSGFAVIVGQCIDMQPDSFTGRDGTEVKKLAVLIKPSDEAAPIELEVWGDLADKFQAAEPITETLVIQTSVAGREWQGKSGETFRRTSLRIKEWEILTNHPEVNASVEQAKADAPF